MKTITIKKLVANMFCNAEIRWEDYISFWRESYVRVSCDGYSYINLENIDGFSRENVYLLAKRTQKEIVEIISNELPEGGLENLVRYTTIKTLKLIK